MRVLGALTEISQLGTAHDSPLKRWVQCRKKRTEGAVGVQGGIDIIKSALTAIHEGSLASKFLKLKMWDNSARTVQRWWRTVLKKRNQLLQSVLMKWRAMEANKARKLRSAIEARSLMSSKLGKEHLYQLRSTETKASDMQRFVLRAYVIHRVKVKEGTKTGLFSPTYNELKSMAPPSVTSPTSRRKSVTVESILISRRLDKEADRAFLSRPMVWRLKDVIGMHSMVTCKSVFSPPEDNAVCPTTPRRRKILSPIVLVEASTMVSRLRNRVAANNFAVAPVK
eukprot:TRINITY_DN23381_c0_g1_i1.p1 TRINITY_DN23381_c0_g1~~TRINITY_DN23381_c0_g1_i1.p1  ORF type:complete len:292 (+),score=43.23 TRINITY_DN23381_c0_g1_i1:33-878(+)